MHCCIPWCNAKHISTQQTQLWGNTSDVSIHCNAIISDKENQVVWAKSAVTVSREPYCTESVRHGHGVNANII